MINTSEIPKNARKLRPFDSANLDDFALYRSLPYYRDTDLCTPEMITLVTGNVIKYFQYTVQDPFSLSGSDALAVLKIKEYEEHEKERLAVADQEAIEEEAAALEEAEAALTGDSSAEPDMNEKQRADYLDIDFE